MAQHFSPELVSGNIYIRPNTLDDIGDKIHGHKHNFDHTTIVLSGAVHVVRTLADGTTQEDVFTAPDSFLVLAGVEHEITAVRQDTTFWCVYSHRDPQGRITQEYHGWVEAYT